MTGTANAAQADFWNGEIGRRWADLDVELEALNRSVAGHLLAESRRLGPHRVLEIGCGAGGLALALAQGLPAGGQVVAVDISEPLLARARDRAAGLGNLTFLQADAQTADLSGPFDLALSAFGVMFFDDPVAAFANIRRAMKAGGRLLMATFGALSANPWFTMPQAIAQAHLGPPSAAPAGAPGPLAFSDRARVDGLLAAAGWDQPRSVARLFDFHHAGGSEGAADLAVRVGPAAHILRVSGASAADRARVRDQIAAAFAPFATADGLHLPVEINLFAALAP